MIEQSDERSCVTCGATDGVAHLEICRMCRRIFCLDCAWKMRGVAFCSEGCGSMFFQGDEEEDSGDDDD